MHELKETYSIFLEGKMEGRVPSGRHEALLLRLKSLNPQRRKRRKRKRRETREVRKRREGENEPGRTIT